MKNIEKVVKFLQIHITVVTILNKIQMLKNIDINIP